jgi:hypothetical protein
MEPLHFYAKTATKKWLEYIRSKISHLYVPFQIEMAY